MHECGGDKIGGRAICLRRHAIEFKSNNILYLGNMPLLTIYATCSSSCLYLLTEDGGGRWGTARP
jgi:hypothetical protein